MDGRPIRCMAGTALEVPAEEAGGLKLPKIGLGTWENTGETGAQAVQAALDLGYRHVDTAQVYGNEGAVGEGIRSSDVDREDVIVTTKIWRANLGYDDVLDSVAKSLERLGLEYVDLLLIHFPHPRRSLAETLSAMAELRTGGAVNHLGVANFTRAQLEEARTIADAPIVTNQVQYHPLIDQSRLQRYCAAEDVILTAYSPLARGALVGDELLADIGIGYDKSAAQVALRWLVQQDGVVTIPKATSRTHLEENLDVFDFSLSDADRARIRNRSPGIKRRLMNQIPGLYRRNPLP